MSEPIDVEVWADVACPWCYIGTHRLRAGIQAFRRDPRAPDVRVRHRAFQLAPDLPADHAVPERESLAARTGADLEQVDAMLGQVATAARSAGLAFDVEHALAANTARAHALLQYAAAHGVAAPLWDELFAAHFRDGLDVGATDVLVAAAERTGLPREAAAAALDDPRYAAAVASDIELALRLGVTGVPFTVFGGLFAVSGAQDAAVFTDALRQVVAERQETGA
ncbi:DsbA family oxidoreductase [Propionicicella superfundia]|uniref:DsbA family oxidoreductase n=1 Tax=Propionicicella superfundia TaxID=348582 RepID=UPI000416EDCE|nr:DsbA family oxidoreductase [Propionicicella superfundia]